MPRCTGCYTELNPGDPNAYWSGPFICPTCRLRETIEKQGDRTRPYVPPPELPEEVNNVLITLVSMVIAGLVTYFVAWPVLKFCFSIVVDMFKILF